MAEVLSVAERADYYRLLIDSNRAMGSEVDIAGVACAALYAVMEDPDASGLDVLDRMREELNILGWLP